MKEFSYVGLMKKITGILDILICLLLFISSLYKGGFYKEDSLFISMVICMLGLVCLSVKLVLNIRDSKKITKSKVGTIIDSLVLVMPIAYFLPILFGVSASRESAFFEAIRYVNFAIIYFIVRTSENKKIYLTSLVFIGVILAIFGIDELTYRMFEKPLGILSINYLSTRNGKLSSTLQYANITALVMLIASIINLSKLIFNLNKLNINDNIRLKAIVVLEIFTLVLLETAIILTTSRMNILLLVIVNIIYFIYSIVQKKAKVACTTLLMLLASFALVSSIDSYILAQNNFMVIFTYIITLVLTIIAVFLSSKFKENSNNLYKIPKTINKKVVIGGITLFVVLIYVLFMPTSLKVKDDTNKGNIAVRNIYLDFKESMDIFFEFGVEKDDVFRLEIYEFNDSYEKNLVLSISQKDVKNNIYSGKLNLRQDTVKLQMDFKALNSKVSIEELRIDDKKILLSYMFLPDNLMFRLKDTFNKDFNNSLRYIYYKDAIKLFCMSPIIGHGGEGFKSRYQQVQDISYVSSEVHSVPLQILVETGLIGCIAYISICVLTFVIITRLYKNSREDAIVLFLIWFVFVFTSLFDIVFSYGFMINIFAVILGLSIGEYKKTGIVLKDKYELDNKSMLSMVKIATLSISLMSLILITVYSVNLYNASMIIITEENGEISASYERVGELERKVKLDKYNAAYLTSLLSAYDKHIDLLGKIYVMTDNDEDKKVLKNEMDSYIVKQKDIADSLIEYEYYNKYVLDEVSRCYFKHFISYARIYNYNFKNDEIAYVFYVGYGIKLVDRITEIGKVNEVANSLAYNVYKEYLPGLETQNSIINSSMLQQAIEDIKVKIESLI